MLQSAHRLQVLSSERPARGELSTAAQPRPTVEPAAAPRRVALVCVPFQAAGLPSISLGTLAALLRHHGHQVDVHHLNLDFARHVGFAPYEELASYACWLRLLGEWLFADERVAPGAASIDEYRAYLRAHRWRQRALHLERLDLSTLKAQADLAVERWFKDHDWGSYDVVGFGVMFQQLNASLRLGFRIKSAFAHVRIVLGGTAMELPMGQPVLDRHTWLDAVFSGFAERTFPEYVATLPPRSDRVITQATRYPMDELPIPDFDGFFGEIARSGLDGAEEFSVPIETSRGCWWGERQHCIFCGFNALDMKQRNKSADRVYREIVAQSRYGRPFFATDNILPLEFFEDLFERLIADNVKFDTFYETKANLTREQLRTLRRIGVTSIQPGIESLSTPILQHMKKGVLAAQNVWILRAATELGISVAWSILYGFPEEDAVEYAKMSDLLPALAHLPPPVRPAPLLLERYSPLFDQAEHYQLRNIRPTPAHAKAFGHAAGLHDQAYVFDFDYADGREPDAYTTRLNDTVLAWIGARRGILSPRCEVFRIGRTRLVLDSRDPLRAGRAWPRLRVLTDAECELVRLTAELTYQAKLRKEWTHAAPLDEILQTFLRRRWLLQIDGRLVRVLIERERPSVASELRRLTSAGLSHAWRTWRRFRAGVRTRAQGYYLRVASRERSSPSAPKM